MSSLEESRISELLWEKINLNQSKYQKAKDDSDKSLLPGKKFIGKKKRYYGLQRDSQAFRDSPGKPGTKKFNRHLNTQFLKNASSLGATSYEYEAEMEFNHYEVNQHLYYQNKLWENNFHGITTEKENELLMKFGCLSKRTSFNKNNSSSNSNGNEKQQQQQRQIDQSFAKLRKSLRPVFKKPFVTNSEFIIKTESQIINFCQQSMIKSIEIYIPDPYQRILLHGIVDYYSLFSRSVTDENGDRCTIITKPKVFPAFPDQSLTSYLIQEQFKAKAKKNAKKSTRYYNTTNSSKCNTNDNNN